MPLSPWWEEESGLLHPLPPLPPEERFAQPPLLAAPLALRNTRQSVEVSYRIGSNFDRLVIGVVHGRLMLEGERNGLPFTRALTLPGNLDLAHRRIRIDQGEIQVTIDRYPVSAWRRTWTRFWEWMISAVERLWLGPDQDI